MRTWQCHGYNNAGSEILNETVKVGTRIVVDLDLEGQPVNTHTQDRMEHAYTESCYDKIEVFHGEILELHVYTFGDGRMVEDYVQAEPWSSGPQTFLALRNARTKEPIAETLWTEDEIAKRSR